MGISILIAAVAGSMLPLQAAIDARLARAVGSPIWAGAISGLVLTVALVAAVASRGWPRDASFAGLPWWAWTGGLAGGILLTATAALAPRLDTGTLIALVIAGQIVCSLVLDTFGLLGLQVQPLNLKRRAAALLILAGAVLLRGR